MPCVHIQACVGQVAEMLDDGRQDRAVVNHVLPGRLPINPGKFSCDSMSEQALILLPFGHNEANRVSIYVHGCKPKCWLGMIMPVHAPSKCLSCACNTARRARMLARTWPNSPARKERQAPNEPAKTSSSMSSASLRFHRCTCARRSR